MPASLTPTLAIVYQGLFGSALAFGVYFYLLRRISAITAASIAFVLPIVALTIDWIAKEPLRLTGASYAGVAFTLVGVSLGFIVMKFRKPRPAAVAT
jgi:drug/metabolite transporter (DMT)-like permease